MKNLGFPGGSVVKKPPANTEDTETGVWFLGQEDPLEQEMATHSSIRLENYTGRAAWRTTVHGVAQSWTQLSKHALMKNLQIKHRS